MFTHTYQNRFELNPIQGNILMNQIRAEKINNSCRNYGPIINSHRQQNGPAGKKIYPEILNRPTLSPRNPTQNEYSSFNNRGGKKMAKQPLVLNLQRSKSGKKKFEDICRKESLWSKEPEKSPKNGLRRLEHSPSNQNRTTICLKWN